MADDFTLPPVSIPMGTLGDVRGTSVGTGEVVGAMYGTGTGLGAAVRYLQAPSIREGFNPDFDPWDFIKTLPQADQELAYRYANKMGLLVNQESVVNRLARLREEEQAQGLISRSTTGQFLLGVGASFFDVSSLIPVAGVVGKVGLSGRTALKYAAIGGLSAAVDEAVIAESNEIYDPTQALLNIGAGTMLGGGLGAFARLYATPARAARTAEEFSADPVDHVLVGPKDGTSAGAMFHSTEVERQAAAAAALEDRLNPTFEVNPTWSDPIFGTISNMALSPAAMSRKLAVVSQTANQVLQNLLDVPGAVKGTLRGETAQTRLWLLENRARAAMQNHRTAFSQMSAELGGSPHQYGLRGMIARVGGQPPVSKDTFNEIVGLKLRDKAYRYADNEIVDRYAEQSAKAFREHKLDLFVRASDAGLHRTNKFRQTEARVAELERKAAEKQKAVTETPSGRARKTGTKAYDEAVLKAERAKRRLEVARKKLDDFSNHLEQVWVKRAIRADSGNDFIDIMTRMFVRQATAKGGKLDDEMVRSVIRANGDEPTQDAVDEIMDLYEQGGMEALPKPIMDTLIGDLETHARESALAVHREFVKDRTGSVVGDVDPEFSSRWEGRKIHLDDEGYMELTRAGYLLGDPEVLAYQYTRDVGGKVVMKETFGTVDIVDDMDNPLVRRMDDELRSAGLKDGEYESIRAYMRAMNNRILGIHDQTGGEVGKYIVRNTTRYAGSVLTGTAGLTALADVIGQVLTQGLGGFIKSSFMFALARPLASLGSESAKAALIGHDIYLGAIRAMSLDGDESIRRTMIQRGIGTGRARTVSGLFDKFTETAYGTLQYLNGQQFLTHFYRAQGGADLLRKLAKGDLSEKDLDHLAYLGLSKGELDKLSKAPRYNAGEHRGFAYEMIDLNELAKTDRRLVDKVEVALDRNARMMSVAVEKGTLPPMFDSGIAKVAFQFGQYMSAMNDEIFRRHLKYGVLPNDFAQVGQLGFMIGVGISIDILKSVVRGQDPDIDGKFSTPARVAGSIYDAVDRIGLLGMLSPYSKFLAQFGANSLDVDLFGNSGRYRDVDLYGLVLGPSSSLIGRAGSFASSIQVGDGQRALYHFLRLQPFSSAAGIQNIIGQLRE